MRQLPWCTHSLLTRPVLPHAVLGRYLEIFARKNNLRNFWVSVGNEVSHVMCCLHVVPRSCVGAVNAVLRRPHCKQGPGKERSASRNQWPRVLCLSPRVVQPGEDWLALLPHGV
jgi:hypothetical protein